LWIGKQAQCGFIALKKTTRLGSSAEASLALNALRGAFVAGRSV